MKPFECLTSEQVTSVHRLYTFLRRLSIIGQVRTSTRQFSHGEFGKPIRYELKFAEYIPEMKGKLTPEERLGQIFLEACTRQTE